MTKPRVLLVGPTAWDEAEIARCAIEERYELVRFGAYHTEQPGTVDPLALIDEAVARFRGEIDGVVGTHDYPGSLIAGAIAERLGLPGPGLAPLLRAQHKIAAREIQQEAMPEVVPRWRAFSRTTTATLDYPAFVRPAKSVTSRLAQRIDDEAALARYLDEVASHLVDFVRPFNTLWRAAGMEGDDASLLLAEEIVEGEQTTVEGFVQAGAITILGIVDSRMSYQFADLFEKRDRLDTYELQMRVATGQPASFVAGGGAFAMASSVVLRLAADKRIVRYLSAAEIQAVLVDFPDARVHLFGEPGQRLSEMPQDAWRFRYGCINVGGADQKDVERRAAELHARLGIVLED